MVTKTGKAEPSAKGTVKNALEAGADVALVARRTVEGVIEATRELGGDLPEATKKAVSGAVDAAGSLGKKTLKAVRGILDGAADGFREGSKEVAAKREARIATVKPTPPSKPAAASKRTAVRKKVIKTTAAPRKNPGKQKGTP
jgi:hypothetical protein